jgi:hypothetical protein
MLPRPATCIHARAWKEAAGQRKGPPPAEGVTAVLREYSRERYAIDHN